MEELSPRPLFLSRPLIKTRLTNMMNHAPLFFKLQHFGDTKHYMHGTCALHRRMKKYKTRKKEETSLQSCCSLFLPGCKIIQTFEGWRVFIYLFCIVHESEALIGVLTYSSLIVFSAAESYDSSYWVIG